MSAVRVWHVPLAVPAARLDEAHGLLDDEERARAARLRFERDRLRFIAAHAALRLLLARALDLPARQLRFAAGPAGKPRLAGAAAASGLHFNLAHSGDHGLLALARGRELGADLEVMPADRPAPLEIVALFSPGERAGIEALPPAQRRLALYRCWVRKEALLKASGEGIPAGLDRFSVSLGAEARVVLAEDPRWAPPAWWLHAIEPGGEWVGALAARGAPAPVSVAQWQWEQDWA